MRVIVNRPTFSFADPESAHMFEQIRAGLLERARAHDDTCGLCCGRVAVTEYVDFDIPHKRFMWNADAACGVGIRCLYVLFAMLVLDYLFILFFECTSPRLRVYPHKQISIVPNFDSSFTPAKPIEAAPINAAVSVAMPSAFGGVSMLQPVQPGMNMAPAPQALYYAPQPQQQPQMAQYPAGMPYMAPAQSGFVQNQPMPYQQGQQPMVFMPVAQQSAMGASAPPDDVSSPKYARGVTSKSTGHGEK